VGLSDVKGVYIEIYVRQKCMNIREWVYFLAILGRNRVFWTVVKG